MVAVAVTVGGGDVCTSTLVDVAWSVADAAGVQCPNAVVHVVAHPICIRICVTRARTNTQRIRLVAVAIAVALWQVVTTAVVHHAWPVAHPTRIQRSHAIVDVVANAVSISVFIAIAATFANGVRLVPITIAVAHGNEFASAGVNGTGAVANAACI